MKTVLKILACLVWTSLGEHTARGATTNFDDLVANTLYTTGNVISSNGFQFTVTPYPSGANVFVGGNGGAGGGGMELQMPSGSGVSWGLPAGTKFVFFRYGEFNPSSGMTINGSALPLGTRISTAHGLTVGGVQIAVSSTGTSGSNSQGVVFLAGTITSLTVGGVEFAMDDPVALLADLNANFNSDGVNDGRDFLIWQRGFGMASGAFLSLGDAEPDGVVDSVDLALWKFRYGWIPGGPGWAGVVPEPGAAWLACAATAMIVRRRRQLLQTSAIW